MAQVKNFKVDARTIIHLGRESIKDHTTALLELVKNSYDADASIVEVEIYKRETFDKIRIADDGTGMTESDIDDSWLRIGFSEKRKIKMSPKGRRKTGEKGIGRLSTDRLGEELQIISIANGENGKHLTTNGIRINWELFNKDNQELTGVPIEVIENPMAILPLAKKVDTGTELIISKLRQDWTKENVEALCNELSILTPPFSETKDFEIFLKTDIAPEFNGKISPPDFVRPEIELNLEYDAVLTEVRYNIT
ncbi:MAG: ATP-binding protein, partial [Tannerella sp.]|nr:ATP-binding protein [Tannerella sp.]